MKVDGCKLTGSAKGNGEISVVNILVGLAVGTGVTVFVAEPGLLRAPVDGLVRFPRVGTATGEAKGLEAHGLEGDVASEEQQVSPRDAVAILLLDGPEQAAGLVQVAIVGPAKEKGGFG